MKSRPRRRPTRNYIWLEQIALLFTSFIWTTVCLSIVVFAWTYQEIEAYFAEAQAPPASAEELILAPELALAIESTPAVGQALQPVAFHTATPTDPAQGPASQLDAPPPAILPETLNIDEPTPVPILIHTAMPTPLALDAIATAIATPNATPTPQPATTTPTATPQATATASVIPPTATTTATATSTPLPTTAPDPAVSSGQPTRLVIPSVEIDSAVIPVGWRLVEQNGQQYSIWDVADYAVGWHNTTALLGQVGNTVMAGHHNINGEVFKNLVNVEVGDEITVYAGETIYKYQIELKTIVKEKGEPPEVRQRNAQWIAPTTDERLTLVTCWPYTNNTHRVIVVARPIQEP